MARPLRIEYPGAVYHITSRGNARAEIFLTDSDRRVFLEILGNTVKKYNWVCHAFCLLDNHYHLLVETLDPNLSLGMRQLNGVYTQAFNRAHDRVGHVFQGRYKALLVEKESYLLELCRYVVLNPVRAGMVSKPDEWLWSSYKSTAYAGKVPEYQAIDWVLGQFAESRTKARQLYRQFVADGLSDPTAPWEKLVSQVIMGSESFVAGVRKLLGDRQKTKEIPRAQRYPGRPPLARLFADNQTLSKKLRNRRIKEAHITHGYTLKEIADCLGIHYTTASKAISGTRKN